MTALDHNLEVSCQSEHKKERDASILLWIMIWTPRHAGAITRDGSAIRLLQYWDLHTTALTTVGGKCGKGPAMKIMTMAGALLMMITLMTTASMEKQQ